MRAYASSYVQRRISAAGIAIVCSARRWKSKFSLARARSKVEQDLHLKETTVAKLRALAEKMRATDPALYAGRLEVIQRGIASIESQLGVERQLIEAHTRLIGILEIEAESASASLAVDSNTSQAVSQRSEELRALLEASEELERQLRANDEVERYLRPQGAKRT